MHGDLARARALLDDGAAVDEPDRPHRDSPEGLPLLALVHDRPQKRAHGPNAKNVVQLDMISTRRSLGSFVCIGALVGLTAGCGDDGGDGASTEAATGSSTGGTGGTGGSESTADGESTADDESTTDGDTTAGGSDCDEPIVCAWLLNEDGEASAELTKNGGPLLVDVQSVTVDGDFVDVEATGIPSYQITITQAIYDELVARPHAATDFVGGAPLVTVGETIEWGQDIGYTVPPMNEPCYTEDGGGGFWPPGPSCPTDQAHQFRLPRQPVPATQTCYAIIGQPSVALLNGVVVYNWADGGTYMNQGGWHQLAQKFEIYDLDVCLGHATMLGTYHQHLDTPCLGQQFGDEGTEHSPIYGFAADGYPMHGKWFDDGVLAQSCWKTRDYDDPASTTGCGGGGVRDCVLVDDTDPSAGTMPADSPGPNTDETVVSFSGNEFVVVSGFYFEDYYFDQDCADQGGQYLDQHNGHDHDGLGYHYHVTETFPYQPGPSFAGELQAGAPAVCSGTPFGGMMPPPGG